MDLVADRVDPADREADQDADRAALDPVGRAAPVGLAPAARRQDKDRKNLCNKSEHRDFA